jgi:hypothetical protein
MILCHGLDHFSKALICGDAASDQDLLLPCLD